MEIFTDGSHSLKPRMSGVGAVILNNGHEHQIGAYTDKCVDNNVAEVVAIAFAIKYIKDHKIIDNSKDKNIIIYSDSANALRKIHQLSPGKDEFEQQALDFIQDFLQTTSKKVTLFQIKGHVHDGTKIAYYNNIADGLASDYRYIGLVKLQNKLFKQSLKNKKYKNR